MTSRIELLLEMLNQEPHDPFLNYALALEYQKQGNISKAIQLLETLLQRDKSYLAAYYQLGKLYEQSGDMERALSAYENGMEFAKLQGDQKTLLELKEAAEMLREG